MAPKKTRALASSSKQPTPSQATRSCGRGRTGSDEGIESSRTDDSRPELDQASQVQPGPAKKRKRGRPTAHKQARPETVEEEIEVAVQTQNRSQASPDKDETTAGADNEHDDFDRSQAHNRHVRFGDRDEQDEGDEHTSATNITPHPRKMGIKRRKSMSPSGLGDGITKRVKINSSRSSLPPSLTQSQGTDEDATTVIREMQFAPLRAVLDERVRRRLRRSHLSEEQIAIEEHQKRDSRTQQELEQLRKKMSEREQRIADLTLELETQKHFAMQVSDEDAFEHKKINALEAELAELKRQESLNDSTAHQHGADTSAELPDEDMLVLHSSQEQVTYPDLPNSDAQGSTDEEYEDDVAMAYSEDRDSQALADDSSQVGIPRARWENERAKYEEAIVTLSRDANEKGTALKVLTIELQALGFAGDDAEPAVILKSIRDKFDQIRDELDLALPGSLAENASIVDVVEILVANVTEFTRRLRTQDRELQGNAELSTDLGRQVDCLLEHLADREIRNSQLYEMWTQLDKSNDEKGRHIQELEEEADNLLFARDGLRHELDEVYVERDTLFKNLEKLSASLQNYRDEESRLTALITRMEDEHRDSVSRMNTERENTVRDLDNQIGHLTKAKDDAEQLSDQRSREIEDLEAKVQILEMEKDGLLTDVETAKLDRETERAGREQAENDLGERIVDVENLEQRVTNLEVELNQLNETLDDLRQLNESEREQREAAERDLDDRNLQIDEFNKKFVDLSKEANELRMQIWGKQQEYDALEEQMSEREGQYQSGMAAEVARREAADDLAQQRAASILDLQGQLEQVEQQMRVQLEEQNESISALEGQLANRDGTVATLRNDLYEAETRLADDTAQYHQRQQELEASINALQDTIAEREAAIAILQQDNARQLELHNNEIEDRNAMIASLNADVAARQKAVDELEHLKSYLERRVEEEAEQMLQLQGNKDDEIEELQSIIREKQARISDVQKKHELADQAWQDVVEAKDEEINALKEYKEVTSEKTIAVIKECTEIKRRFREYAQSSINENDTLQAEIARLNMSMQEKNGQLRAYAENEMEAIEAMNEATELGIGVFEEPQAKTGKVASSKKGRGRKKRNLDSGIGMGGETEESVLVA